MAESLERPSEIPLPSPSPTLNLIAFWPDSGPFFFLLGLQADPNCTDELGRWAAEEQKSREWALGAPGIHPLYPVCWFYSVQTILEAACPLPTLPPIFPFPSLFSLSPLLFPSLHLSPVRRWTDKAWEGNSGGGAQGEAADVTYIRMK